MKRTKYFAQRMTQRGVSQAMVDLVMAYGDQDGDSVILSRKASAGLMQAARTLGKILDKGGVVVVASGQAQLTTYNFEGRGR